MRCVALLLMSACAASGAFAIGPTIDSNRVVRLEGEAGVGTVPQWTATASLTDPSLRTIGVFSVGMRLALAAGTRLSYSQGWFGGYIEYLQLGTEGAPWGFHAGLTIAIPFEGRSNMLIGLDAGPDRLGHAHSMDTGDGYATTFVTDGLDLTVRGREGSWWQVGALYVRRGTMLYE